MVKYIFEKNHTLFHVENNKITVYDVFSRKVVAWERSEEIFKG